MVAMPTLRRADDSAAAEADRGKISVAQRRAPAAARAGIVEHEFTGVGGHNWQFAGTAFERILPQLAAELGIR
jgi:S-formylglutathione hydrolase FrmB